MNLFIRLVNFNRLITKKVVDLFGYLFGRIDNCELYFFTELNNLNLKGQTVLELGGTWRPLLKKGDDFKYFGIDIDDSFRPRELYDHYFCNSVEDDIDTKADIIVSKYLIEHVKNNTRTFDNTYKWLNKGGYAINIFPLKNHPYSLINKLVGNRTAKSFISLLRPGTETVSGYPAYYNLCSSSELEEFLSKRGWKYHLTYCFGAEDYFGFFFPLGIIIHLYNRICSLFNLNYLASNVVLEIYK